MHLPVTHKSKLLVVFALICAMATSGFAHRFVSEPLDPALAAYVAQGGPLADICGPPGGTSHKNTQTCEACRLVNAVILPSFDAVCAIRIGEPSRVQTRQGSENPAIAKLDLTRAARGPPAV
jgi:hypothetical protein